MRGKDQATLKPFLSFLADGGNGRDKFRVAHFQRPYVWPERFVWQLMEDLWEFFSNDRTSKVIGCVITHATAGNVHEIVDGQQRLITLHIVFRAVVYWCRRHGEGDLPPFMQSLFACDEPHKAFKCKEKDSNCWIPRLTLFDWDEATWFHTTFLSSIEDTDERIDQLLQDEEVPQQRLPFVNNFKTVLSFLSDRKGSQDIRGGLNAAGNVLLLDPEEFKNRVRGGQPGDLGFYMSKQFNQDVKGLGDIMECLDDFLQYAIEKTTIIHFVTYDATMAVDIFNALNRPGLPLAAPQRLKASLLVNIDYSTVDSATSLWHEAERKMMTLVPWDKEPLTPFLRCLLEITPKPPSVIAEDHFYKTPSLPGKFRQSHRLDLLDEFQEFCVEIRPEGKLPPAPPTERHRLYQKSGQPNNDAVGYFIEMYLNGPLVPMYISLVSLGDQNSWGEGQFGYFSEDVKIKVQNSVSCLRHLHHLDLDRDWVYPALLASHLWGLHEPQSLDERLVDQFFARLETFASYLVFCRPTISDTARADNSRVRRDKAHPPTYAKATLWSWPDKALREDRMTFYRELMDQIYKQSPGKVVEWLALTKAEQDKFRMVLAYDSVKEDHLFCKEEKFESDGTKMQKVVHAKVDPELQKKVLTYLLLKAEVEMSNTPQELMESFEDIALGLRKPFSAESLAEEYRQLDVRPLVMWSQRATFHELNAGWKPAELMFVRDHPSLGNLSLTLQNRRESPESFDGYGFSKFLADTNASPHLHGFVSTMRTLPTSNSFTFADLERRHKLLMLLAQKSWGVIAQAGQAQLDQELARCPPGKSRLKETSFIFPAVVTEDVEEDANGGYTGESDVHSIRKGEAPLRVGVRVQLHGLQNAAYLNGKMGNVTDYVESNGRYQVLVDGEGVKSFKAENLKTMSWTPTTPAYTPNSPIAKPKAKILPAAKRKHVSTSEPNAKTFPCRAWEKCNNWYCQDAHNVSEWRCAMYVMGQCVPECCGFVMSCPAKQSDRKRKLYGVSLQSPPAKIPRSSASQASVKEVPKAAFKADGVAPWAKARGSINGVAQAVPKVMQAMPKLPAANQAKWPSPGSWGNVEQQAKAPSNDSYAGVWGSSASASSWDFSSVMYGTVTQLFPWSQYGFITPDGAAGKAGRQFFHFSALVPQWSLIRMHDRVTFTIGQNPKTGRPCAECVIRLQPNSWW